MKKKTRRIIIILFLIILIFYTWKHNQKDYTLSYQVNQYQVKEQFYKNDSSYDIIISKDKNTYVYTINQNLHQKKIIKEIKTYKKGKVVCIFPQYKKEIENQVYCSLGKQQVSIDYLIKTENDDFKAIQKKIKKYHITYPKENNKKTKYRKLTVYNQNIPQNQVYYLWDYKGIIVLEKEENFYQKVLDYDLYDNVMACTIGNYYVLLENTSVNGIKNVYYLNSNTKKLKEIELEKTLSKDSYINGVVEDKIYLTDEKAKKEYTLDIKKEKIEEIDEDQTKYITYEDGIKKELSKSDFFLKEQYFSNNSITDSKISSSDDIRKEKRYYYYLEDNKLYKVLENKKNKPILLLELEEIKEWTIVEKEILLLKEDTIYAYNDKDGLRMIVQGNELNYNYKNIYKIGEK